MCIRGELDMVDFLEHLHHLLPPRSTWCVAGHSEGNHRFLRGWQRPLISLNVCWWEIWPGFTVDGWVWISKLQGVGAPWCRVFQAALWRSCKPVKITKIRLSYNGCACFHHFSSCRLAVHQLGKSQQVPASPSYSTPCEGDLWFLGQAVWISSSPSRPTSNLQRILQRISRGVPRMTRRVWTPRTRYRDETLELLGWEKGQVTVLHLLGGDGWYESVLTKHAKGNSCGTSWWVRVEHHGESHCYCCP